ncbi:hypothetical protein TSUD_334340 [Trifolium subterraneum]|uniref:F-box domain-containing protein n=1 Tax=Trifolium subterraneum TaxID=3900 RepID=A0A2Z6LWH1_TRISU|nr:hypothetical protein TSUD_334340 [Trifolium subterraneum]
MGNWAMGDWEWEFRWKTSLDLLDQDLLSDLIESLRQVNLSSTEDQWCWRHEIGGSFSVKSAYLVLEDKARLQRPLPGIDFLNLARVWDSWATSKVIVFSWQLLQDRIPTRQNLRRRQVLVGATDSSCVVCGAVEESVDHIFVSCDRISSVWYRVSRWLGVEYVSPSSIMQVFESFFGLGVGCRVRLGFILVWHAVVWTIWTSRNDIIFAAMKNEITELPDCVISNIFSKLCLKDLVKTSTLSKQWLHEWGFKMDLNFDMHNIFHNNTIQYLQEDLSLFQSGFVTRLNEFMLHYQGAIIRSIRVNFPLGDEHSYVIDSLISQGIAKGANRIELLFLHDAEADDLIPKIEPYKFSFTLLSDTDSLKYLHLEKCLIVEPMDFSGLKNLTTLVLHQVVVNQDMIHGLFSNCTHLGDFTLNACNLKSDLKIISSTLFHLNIVHIKRKKNIDIIASNLSSFDYSYTHKYAEHKLNIKAPMLSKCSYKGSQISKRFGFSGIKNVTTIVFDGLKKCLVPHIPLLFSECLHLENVTFKNCRMLRKLAIISAKLLHLNLIDCGDMGYTSPYRIDIDAMNLSSFECSYDISTTFCINAPKLLKVFWNATKREPNLNHFGLLARLHQIENLAITINHSQVS